MKTLNLTNIAVIVLGAIIATAFIIAIVQIASGNFHSTIAI